MKGVSVLGLKRDRLCIIELRSTEYVQDLAQHPDVHARRACAPDHLQHHDPARLRQHAHSGHAKAGAAAATMMSRGMVAAANRRSHHPATPERRRLQVTMVASCDHRPARAAVHPAGASLVKSPSSEERTAPPAVSSPARTLSHTRGSKDPLIGGRWSVSAAFNALVVMGSIEPWRRTRQKGQSRTKPGVPGLP
jgi:hypothetical protein